MISVIVPALNEEKELKACLQALSQQGCCEGYEIIVVDGGSKDGTVPLAERYADRVIPQVGLGIGGARRDGAAEARGDKLAFTDADTVVGAQWLQSISTNLSDWDASTGPVIYLETDLKSELIERWRSLYRVLGLSRFCYIIGSNMAVRKDSYWRAGGHGDISLLDDYDLSCKLFRAGAASKFDSRQTVYTSARRVEKLFTYAALVAYGHYYYDISPDHKKLLNYPKPEEMGWTCLWPNRCDGLLRSAQSVLRGGMKRIK
ncbi:MAG: glycosyltransferase [Methanotrichaceae archaeon]|nr:glycosyltransferase [Methanotrichaceae archaeon]